MVLLSGGMDSALTAVLAQSEGFDVYALTFDYGQRHAIEVARAAEVAAAIGVVEHRVMSIDLAALGGLDAELSIAAKGLTYAGFRVDQPRIEATLVEEVLTLRKLGGRMFDGAFALSGTLDARRIPVLNGTVRVSKANVGKALFQAAAAKAGSDASAE